MCSLIEVIQKNFSFIVDTVSSRDYSTILELSAHSLQQRLISLTDFYYVTNNYSHGIWPVRVVSQIMTVISNQINDTQKYMIFLGILRKVNLDSVANRLEKQFCEYCMHTHSH